MLRFFSDAQFRRGLFHIVRFISVIQPPCSVAIKSEILFTVFVGTVLEK